MVGFDGALAEVGALGGQVGGGRAEHGATVPAWEKTNPVKHKLVPDFRRQMLPSYGAMETNEQSPIFRYAKRAYFIIDKNGILRWQNIKPNPLDLLDPNEVLKALKDLGP